MQCRHRFHIPCEKNDAALDGQAPPCKFSGAERRRAEWAGAAMQILRSRATPRWMGRRRHADSPEKSDALGDGQAAPCWMARHRHVDSPEQRDAVLMGRRRHAGTASIFLVRRTTPLWMGRRRHADSPEKSDALGDGQAAPCWMARHRHADSPEQRDAVGDGQVPPCRFSGAERRRAGWAGVA
ncbi:Hypothetical predicted protein [Cloeon dipterum]|uniref:Uncharacterized protein n=1 Tax=Cloeon dipterum TaxID=197152 RepID=A0A8S1E5V8_9INSE|nr:Hypothetical predicted protein [Cloeon dipterum]